jgi:hypothetical protein
MQAIWRGERSRRCHLATDISDVEPVRAGLVRERSPDVVVRVDLASYQVAIAALGERSCAPIRNGDSDDPRRIPTCERDGLAQQHCEFCREGRYGPVAVVVVDATEQRYQVIRAADLLPGDCVKELVRGPRSARDNVWVVDWDVSRAQQPRELVRPALKLCYALADSIGIAERENASYADLSRRRRLGRVFEALFAPGVATPIFRS